MARFALVLVLTVLLLVAVVGPLESWLGTERLERYMGLAGFALAGLLWLRVRDLEAEIARLRRQLGL